MTLLSGKRILVTIAACALATLLLGFALFAMIRLFPRHDPLPSRLARGDEKVAARAAETIGTQVDQANRDTSIHLDLTTKEIRDAFDAVPPPAAPDPDGRDRALPAAPVNRVRDRLNEGIARANRSAGTAGAPD